MVVDLLLSTSHLERILILAPALVIGAGLVLAVLTWLGVTLPKE